MGRRLLVRKKDVCAYKEQYPSVKPAKYCHLVLPFMGKPINQSCVGDTVRQKRKTFSANCHLHINASIGSRQSVAV
jgi:hypothetical protein